MNNDNAHCLTKGKKWLANLDRTICLQNKERIVDLHTFMLALSVVALIGGIWMSFNEARREAEDSPQMKRLRDLEREFEAIIRHK